jgi:hypothetical protein
LKAFLSCCLFFVVVLLSNVCASAQFDRGVIVGSVRDTSGASVSGVKITLVKEATKTIVTTVSNRAGDYVFNDQRSLANAATRSTVPCGSSSATRPQCQRLHSRGQRSEACVGQNQFEVAAGGPIRLDRLFYFGDYEGFRRILRSAQTATLPT